MADLNIRNVDVTLVTRLKVDAAQAGRTLREYCIGLLEGSQDANSRRPGSSSSGETERAGRPAGLSVLRQAKSKAKHVHQVQPVRDELGERDEHHGRSTMEQQPVETSMGHDKHTTYLAGTQRYCSDCRCYY